MSIMKFNFFGVFVLLLASCNLQPKDTFNVTVSAYGGDVEVIRGDDVLAIRLAMQLELNDIVKVPSDGYVQLLFKEGAVVTGMADSALQLPKEGIVRLIQGESFYHIEKQQARSFVVQTDQAQIAVYGTQFMVEAKADKTHVALLSGAISIELQEKTFDLGVGQEVNISEGEEIFTAMSPETLERFNAVYHLSFPSGKEDEAVLLDDELDNNSLDNRILEEYIEKITSLQRQMIILETNATNLEEEVARLKELAKNYENLYRVEREWVERYKRLLEQNGVAILDEES